MSSSSLPLLPLNQFGFMSRTWLVQQTGQDACWSCLAEETATLRRWAAQNEQRAFQMSERQTSDLVTHVVACCAEMLYTCVQWVQVHLKFWSNGGIQMPEKSSKLFAVFAQCLLENAKQISNYWPGKGGIIMHNLCESAQRLSHYFAFIHWMRSSQKRLSEGRWCTKRTGETHIHMFT